MSDIQKYYGTCEQDDEDGQYVKYDDHIQKINEKCRRTAIVTAESWNKQVEKLQARIDELEEMLSYIATGDVFKLKDVRNLLETKQ